MLWQTLRDETFKLTTIKAIFNYDTDKLDIIQSRMIDEIWIAIRKRWEQNEGMTFIVQISKMEIEKINDLDLAYLKIVATVSPAIPV